MAYRAYLPAHPAITYARTAFLLAAAASLVLAFVSARASAGTDGLRARTLTLDDGRERRYFLYTPPGGGTGGIVLVLHGSGGNAARIRAFTARRFESLADEKGLLVVYPEGFEGNWNGCRRAAPFSANRLDVDDVAFLRAVTERHAVTGGRVLAFGFSGGGHMALRVVLEAPDLVDAVSVVGASLPAAENNDCTPVRSSDTPAVLLINGTDDPINPYGGGDIVLPPELGGARLGRVLSSLETAQWLAERAGHRAAASTEAGAEVDGNPGTAITWSRWRSPDLPEIAQVTVNGGGHTIPQPGTVYPALLGAHSADLDAPLEAWTFIEGQ